VPTMIFIPSESIAFANCLASLSVGNVLVCPVDAGDVNRHCFDASNETNHRLVVTIRLAKMATLFCFEPVFNGYATCCSGSGGQTKIR
jgi:hypothetical protein